MGNVSGDFPRGNSSVIGTFVASGATQDIMIVSGMDTGVDPGLSGFILTDADGVFISAFNVGRTAGDDVVLNIETDPGREGFLVSGVGLNEAGTAASLTWQSLPDRSYTVETSVDLITWEDAATNIQTQGEQTTFVADGVEPVARARFYRIKEE